MPVGIFRGSRDHCLRSLATDAFDLDRYPLLTYEMLDTFRLGGRDVRIYQGVNPVPQSRFQVSLDDPAARLCVMEPPGVVPFLVSAFQVTAKRRVVDPNPTQVGLPLLTTETDFLIRWMFRQDGASHGGQTLWRRLSAADLAEIPEPIRPDPNVQPNARSNESYRRIGGSATAPEPVDFVLPRVDCLPHEPWLARSVELAKSWRVVVPNTSISCRPVVVPPDLTIIGQNFNVLLCDSGDMAVAIGVVLSRADALRYLTGISPWSQGDTPRPRSKHVNTTLWMFKNDVEQLLDAERDQVRGLAEDIQVVWRPHLQTALSIARGDGAEGIALRNRYRAIEPRDSLAAVPTALVSLADRTLVLAAGDVQIKVEFQSNEDAALAAIAFWTAMPRALAIGEVLSLRFHQAARAMPNSVQRVFFERRWATLVGAGGPDAADEAMFDDDDAEEN